MDRQEEKEGGEGFLCLLILTERGDKAIRLNQDELRDLDGILENFTNLRG